MSTKTSIKRIALVAVSALGFGLLSVVPAKAAELGSTVTAINAIAASANVATINNPQTVFVGITTAALNDPDAGAADTLKISGKVTGFPVGGSVLIAAGVAATAATDGDLNLDGTVAVDAAAGVYNTCTNTAKDASENVLADTTTATAAGAGFCKFTFTPTVAGTYTITLWAERANVGFINDDELSNTISVTVGAAGASSSEQFLTSDSTTAGANGTLAGVKVSSVGIQTILINSRYRQSR
jgi:hypothetical protein